MSWRPEIRRKEGLKSSLRFRLKWDCLGFEVGEEEKKFRIVEYEVLRWEYRRFLFRELVREESSESESSSKASFRLLELKLFSLLGS